MPSSSRPSRPASPTGIVEVARSGSLPERVDPFEDRGRRQSIEGRPDPRVDLAETFDRLHGPMTRASRRILGDDGLAEDAIQETLLSFWTRGEPPENPQAWLLHAITLRSLHLARTRRRRREYEERACLGRPEWNPGDDPARSLDYEDLLRILEESLRRVPDEYRAVFMLWAIEEMDYAGISEALHIPIGTVRSRLSRARRAIRQHLSDMLAEQAPRMGSHQNEPSKHPA
jgi:RNA polymerase sigma-70 factor, ECF subfamily